MTKQDRQKVIILSVLLAVLASVVVMVLRMNDTPATTTAAVQVPETSKISVNPPGGGFVAVLSDDSRHYSVTTGEVLMGRYRVLTISDKIVDVEDLEYKRRQSLPIVK